MNEPPASTETAAASPSDAAARKQRYKKSLNLPRTSFEMKANLAQNEPASQRRWQAIDLYSRVLEARAGAPPFVFHDGPPYANGDIHTGHLLNKVLKDLVVRSRNVLGERCAYIPGWDCHGLPIEHRVMTELEARGRMDRLNDLPEDQRRMAIRRACQLYAQKYKDLQAAQMQRLHTLADYPHPYLTMEPDYERGVLEVFAGLIDQGLVYRDKKPVHWSIANETALAEAELEYYDREDPSIYVWFDAEDPAELWRRFGAANSVGAASLLIWTTTPWTLPANLLIAVSPNAEYALVRLGERTGVVAQELLGKVPGLATQQPQVLGRARGQALVGLRYRHPFVAPDERNRNAFRVVAADHVTLTDGTGLVHTAPGHGADDYWTGMREGVAIYCPVQDDGSYDQTVPADLRGLSIWDANPRIVERVRQSGHLHFHHTFTHSYPHDWRSKTPVVFRATEQWFIAVDRPLREPARGGKTLRQLAIEATDARVSFVPEWGRNRMRGMLESRPDWCISRQRSWGLPIPAFRLPDGRAFLTAASTRAVAAVVGRLGSDAWFTRSSAELLAGYEPGSDPEAPEEVRTGAVPLADWRKMYDIFDVWFESGSSWHAVLRRRGEPFPTDLYLEGSDQHRGWFQASLLPALGITGEPPFRSVVTHGFVVDKDGQKMSKSVGNALEVEELLQHFGADVCRWWVSAQAFDNDIKVDLSFFQVAGESYRKVRNTLRFLLGNLADWQPGTAGATGPALAPTSLDAWALAMARQLAEQVRAAYLRYDFRAAHLLLYDFCNDTLSSVYLDAVKDRLYCDAATSPRRRATQAVLHQLASLLCRLLAPILPHTADEAWRALLGTGDQAVTVHTEVAAAPEAGADARWPRVLALRDAVRKALEDAKATGIENPLDAGVVVPDPGGELAAFATDLPDLFGCSRVRRDPEAAAVTVVDLRGEPRCERSWRRDETVKLRGDGGTLSDRDAAAVGVA